MKIPSEIALHNLLKECNVPIHLWGTGKAKPVSSLLQEIRDGETLLQIGNNGLKRVGRIVKIHVKDPSNPQHFVLVEVEQKLPDGRTRPRGQEPSGKIRPGESPKQALERELLGELQLLLDNCYIETGRLAIEENESPSYPGLTTTYEIHHFVVTPKPGSLCLQDKFSVEETTEEGVWVSYFEWRTVTSSAPRHLKPGESPVFNS